MIDLGDNVVNLWEARLLYDGKKLLRRSVNNVFVFLKFHPGSINSLAYNEFSGDTVVMRECAWAQIGPFPRKFSDDDAVEISSWLESVGQQGITKSVAFDVAKALSQSNPIHPLRQYIWDLVWDKKPRINNWLTYYLGVKPSAYAQSVGSKYLIGAIARVLKPGCKMDNMLVLEGPQGLLKSTAIRTLFGTEYFTDEISSFGSKDAAMQLSGVWGVEVAELSEFHKTEVEKIKEFVSRSIDRFRPPYGRSVIERKRTSVMIGTSNSNEYLRDATGARRFWPVECLSIDIEALKNDRDQLWAEAAERYRNDERWWLTIDEIDVALGEQNRRYAEDIWTKNVLHYLEGKPYATTVEILTTALSLDIGNLNDFHKKRVVGILTVAGWKLHLEKVEGRTQRVYRPVSVTPLHQVTPQKEIGVTEFDF